MSVLASADQACGFVGGWTCAPLRLPMVVSSTFVALGLWHFYMAISPVSHLHAAVPSVDGMPVIRPSRAATVAVGFALLLCAGLVAGAGGIAPSVLPKSTLRWLSGALSLGLIARAVGELKYVGFFKRVRNSTFATLDTWVYSPLCVLLSLGVALVICVQR